MGIVYREGLEITENRTLVNIVPFEEEGEPGIVRRGQSGRRETISCVTKPKKGDSSMNNQDVTSSAENPFILIKRG